MGISRTDALAQAKVLARRTGATIQNETDIWDRVLVTLTNRFNILRATKSVTVADGADLRSAGVIGPEFKVIDELPDGSGYITGVRDTTRKVDLYRLELAEIINNRNYASGNGNPGFYAIQSGAGTDNLLLFPIPSGNVSLSIRYFYTHPIGSTSSSLPVEWNDAIVKMLAYELALQVGDYALAGVLNIDRPDASAGLGRIASYAIWNAYKIRHSRGRVVYHGF